MDLVSAAKSCSRDQFVSQYSGWYLVPAREEDRARQKAPTLSRRQALARQVTEASDEADNIPVRVVPLRAKRDDAPIHVGRTDENDVVISGHTVSRRHAAFVVSVGRVEVVDLGSRNGTRVRGIPLRAGESQSLVSGDPIDLGSIRLVLVDAAACWSALREE